MSRYLDIRATLPEGRITDVKFSDICEDIEQVIADIYDLADMTLSNDALANMRHWEAEHQQHKHGKHNYTLEDYGLSDQAVDRAFARYRSMFFKKR